MRRWAQQDLRPAEIDPEALSWAMHRRFNLRELPTDHAVLEFGLPDVEIRLRRFWFVIDDGQVDVCLKNPGRDADLTLVTSIRTLLMVYLGRVAPDAASARERSFSTGPVLSPGLSPAGARGARMRQQRERRRRTRPTKINPRQPVTSEGQRDD